LLLATCGKFTVLLATEDVQASYLRFLPGFPLGRGLSLHGREAIEEQLGNISQGNGVTASDTFAGELLDEIAKEEIHGAGGGEIIDIAEKVGGEDLGLHGGTVALRRPIW